MCARRLTGGARRESESASYSPTSRVCRVFEFFIFHSLEETSQLSEKTTEGWNKVKCNLKMAFTYCKLLILWQVDSAASLFFCTRKWWVHLFLLCTQSRGKAVWHKWRQGEPGEDSHEKSLETKTWSSCCLLKARWSIIWWAWEQWTYAHKQVHPLLQSLCFCSFSFSQQLLEGAQQVLESNKIKL